MDKIPQKDQMPNDQMPNYTVQTCSTFQLGLQHDYMIIQYDTI